MARTAALLCALTLLSGWTALATPPPAEGGGAGGGGGGLNQLLGRAGGGAGETSSGRGLQTRASRVERLTHLSEGEREIRTKQIMAAISEMVNSECSSNRDYQGWVDFGRRSAERTE